ncbi:MAG: ferredoxin [Candidatus Paceibacterota bacterium]
MFKIIHERNKCIRCGACAAVCPELFEMSEKDKLAFLRGSKEKNNAYELECEEMPCAKEAEDVCPVKIIKVEKKL